jgi:hypothetical protein
MAEEQQAVESTDQPVEQSVEQQTEDVSRETSEQQEVMDRPEIIPEKFWNADTGEINLEDMAKSYNHLEKFASGKKDEMRESLIAELTQEARELAPEEPSGYELPKLVEGVTEDMVEANPLTDWWRAQCHERGYSQEDFQDGINKYIDTMMGNQPNLDAEVERLGENANDRINAVNAWASSFFPPEEFDVIASSLGTSAEGIAALERMQESMQSVSGRSEQVAQPERELGIDDVKAMMNDPRYHDPRHRETSYVERVNQAWNRLNMSGKI